MSTQHFLSLRGFDAHTAIVIDDDSDSSCCSLSSDEEEPMACGSLPSPPAGHQSLESETSDSFVPQLNKDIQSSAQSEPSGIPGLGNSILGPRHRVSCSASSATPMVDVKNNNATTSSSYATLSNNSSKRKATSTPSPSHPASKAPRLLGTKTLYADYVASKNQAGLQPRIHPDTAIEGRAEVYRLSREATNILAAVPLKHPRKTTPTLRQINDLLSRYSTLHPTCPAARPLQLIQSSLSSPSLSPTSLLHLLRDTAAVLDLLSTRQLATLNKLQDIKAALQRVGMENIVEDARVKVEKTQEHVRLLGEWIQELEGEFVEA